MAIGTSIFGVLRRISVMGFALFVGLSFSFPGTLNNNSENDGELIEEVKAADVRTDHGRRVSQIARTKVVNHSHVDSNGSHFLTSHQPLASGHFLANGLRAPLRC